LILWTPPEPVVRLSLFEDAVMELGEQIGVVGVADTYVDDVTPARPHTERRGTVRATGTVSMRAAQSDRLK
jgi:hypothetical protein